VNEHVDSWLNPRATNFKRNTMCFQRNVTAAYNAFSWDETDSLFKTESDGRKSRRRTIPLVAFVVCAIVAVLIIVTLGGLYGYAILHHASPVLPHCGVDNYESILNLAPWTENRVSLVGAFNASKPPGFAFFVGNSPLVTGDSDTTLLFRQDSDFLYVCGIELPNLYLAIDLANGMTTLFVTPLDEIWNGVNLTPAQWTAQENVNQTLTAPGDFASFLEARAGQTVIESAVFF
jgi:hypothetical protein